MATLTVTARGQVTFRKDVLKHLGIEPGGKIEVDLLPDGRAALKAARPSGSVDGFLGLLAGRTSKIATLEEIGEGRRPGMGRRTLRIAVDTNVLIRGVVRDDPSQAKAADKVLKDASGIAIALPCLCEFVWVLRRVYGFAAADIVTAIQALLNTGNVVLNRPAVEAGLAFLQAGGDFADGAIAYEGKWLGGDTFVSFDRKAVALVKAQGYAAQLLA